MVLPLTRVSLQLTGRGFAWRLAGRSQCVADRKHWASSSVMTKDIAAKPEQPLARNSTDRRLKIAGKLKTALDLMVWGGEDGAPLDYSEAARTANLTARSMRRALERPHVRMYLRGQRDVFRASISARVIFRLDELARQNDNRAAAVSASRTILQLEDEAEARPARGTQQLPGLCIVIQAPASQPPAPPTIDVTREVDGERGG
jgi:hypothetical protein